MQHFALKSCRNFSIKKLTKMRYVMLPHYFLTNSKKGKLFVAKLKDRKRMSFLIFYDAYGNAIM